MRARKRIFRERRRREPTGRTLGRTELRRHEFKFRRRRGATVAAIATPPEELTGRPGIRLNVLGVIILVLFSILVLRLWALQIIDHSQYDRAVTSTVIRTVTIPAPRGLISTRTGTVLAGDQVQEQLVLSRETAKDDPEIIGKVAALAGESPSAVKAALVNSQNSPYQPVPILTGVSMTTIQYLLEHHSEFPGVTLQQISERTYPAGGTVATPILGYVSAISATELKGHSTGRYSQATQFGQSGLESSYQDILAGQPGKRTYKVNALNNVVGPAKKKPKTAVQGDTVVTNITLNLQKAVQNALLSDMAADRQSFDATTRQHPAAATGAAVVMNVQTGAVLSLVSEPSYNLDVWLGGISQANYTQLNSSGAFYNYVTQGLYTPGSSFKLASATAALQTGVVAPYVGYNDTGTYKIPGCRATCTFHDNTQSDAGSITLPLAIAESDDDYFYNIGYNFAVNESKYGNTPIQSVANQYGIGELTGIDLPNEVQGRVDSPTLRRSLHNADPKAYPYDTWYIGTNLEMAFGQGETVVTPIEMADAYATFANGGRRYAPEVAGEIVKPNGKIEKVAPKVESTVNIPPAISTPILQGLEGVVASTRGTAHGTFVKDATFSLTSFRIAGKTGTADISAAGLGHKEPDSWFIAFGPEPNPTYVVAVAVGQGGYGASAAAPAVIDIFNYLVSHPITTLKTPTTTSPSISTAPPTPGTPIG